MQQCHYNPDNYKRIHLIIKDHCHSSTLKSFRTTFIAVEI